MITKILALLIGREMIKYKRAQARTQKLARQEAQRRMNEFVSIASHELKTPLTSIKGNIQLMGRRLKADADTIHSVETHQLLMEARELLDRTDQQVGRLTHLVNSLLETSRINANTMDLLFEACDLNGLLQRSGSATRAMFRQNARSISLFLTIKVSSSWPILVASNR